MQDGSITSYIDTAQVVLYAFWAFFAGLVFYLRREDKREGYPLDSDRSGRVVVQGFPAIPSPKTFLLSGGHTYTAPDRMKDDRPIHGQAIGAWPGAPIQPDGDPMYAAIGPGAYANRADVPEHTFSGEANIVPLRVATDAFVAPGNSDPRGMTVYGADHLAAGKVTEIWTDRAEPQIRYLEVEVANGGKHVLLPMTFARIDSWNGRVDVRSILAKHFTDVPALRNPDVVTKLEEDKITAFYAGGTLYATPGRIGGGL